MKPLPLLLALALSACSSTSDFSSDGGAKQAGNVYQVRLDRSGAAIDTSGAVIRREYLITMLETKKLDQRTPVLITVVGTQTLGVQETSEMFTGLGFKSVKIDLVLTDPMKKGAQP